MANGSLSVDTEHLFPIIKKWLYSEKDIFVREVISNACDAITKHKRLVSLGEAPDDGTDYRVAVSANKDEQTITVTDNGIGMDAEEVDKYINNIALSGALDFISRYEGEGSSGIIGHFGLGFYSMFIVSEKVELFTKSYKGGAGVHWICDSEGSFTSEECEYEGHGTRIIMHVADDETAYLDTVKLRTILERYCAFMPYPIALTDAEGKENVINDTDPLWQRNPQDVTEEQYNEFYKKVFGDYQDPLFRVHVVADYPLNFKGVLFIPRRKTGYDSTESEIKLFYNSVCVADYIKEACPDWLVNIKGVLDCPELPLNVSRSYLQNDVYVRKIASHIAKKIADRINYLFSNEREALEKNWRDMKPYFEYACMRDEKFAERVNDSILIEKVGGGFCTVKEYLGEGAEGGDVYYTNDAAAQSYYVDMYRQKGKDVLIFDNLIDNNYAQFLESKNEKLKFKRIDSSFGDGTDGGDSEALSALFRKASGKEELKIAYADLGEEGAAALISLPEEGRRIADMMRMYSISSGNPEQFDFPADECLTVNRANPVIKALEQNENDEDSADKAKLVYLSALLLSRTLKADEAKEFIRLNNKFLAK
ncbi:MAG: molecular chaperone HtpG [Clostridia bacterium]|nr:molecular chaperone HtpG [Clostridia bacterium]